jgi:hypothetical protein
VEISIEVLYYNRAALESFKGDNLISLLFILFIDDFSIYKNIYRALKGFYIILASLNYKERRKSLNKFILILGLYGTPLKAIINNLALFIKSLARGIYIEINKREILIKAFLITLMSDMP